MTDVVLPAFEMDCRDWIVVRPAEAGLPEDEAGVPVVAMLSTSVIEDDIHEATGSITIGLMDPSDELDDITVGPVSPGAVAHEMLEDEPGTRRYLVPAPSNPAEQRLALLAEFSVPPHAAAEFDRRVAALMDSFRWQAA